LGRRGAELLTELTEASLEKLSRSLIAREGVVGLELVAA
jgi:hypothetical protein